MKKSSICYKTTKYFDEQDQREYTLHEWTPKRKTKREKVREGKDD